MDNDSKNRSRRLLNIYEMLIKGDCIRKKDLAEKFSVTLKTIQRDIDDVRTYFYDEHNVPADEEVIRYDRTKGGYFLVKMQREWFTSSEVLAICKVLLESRGFSKKELDILVDKMLMQASEADSKKVKDMIKNEKFLYVAPLHGEELIEKIWDLSSNIAKSEIIKITYKRQDKQIKTREVKPVSIMFSEYYFYLIAFMADDSKDAPAVFRVDRLLKIENTKNKFLIPYKDRFSDGEFRKRVQFMYTGKLKNVKFKFKGPSLEAVLDRLPTAQVISQVDGISTISVEVYGDGIDMWLRSQGDWVEVI